MGQVCAKELLRPLLLRLPVPGFLSLLAVRPHLHQHFSNFSCNMCPRCTLDAGIETWKVPDHESVPMEHKELVGDGCYHVRNTDDRATSVRSVCEELLVDWLRVSLTRRADGGRPVISVADEIAPVADELLMFIGTLSWSGTFQVSIPASSVLRGHRSHHAND